MVLQTTGYSRDFNHGSEFTALRIAIEKVERLRYKIRMMGLPMEGPANGLCDSQSVVPNSTLPSSIQKNYSAVKYHKCQESIANSAVDLIKETGETARVARPSDFIE